VPGHVVGHPADDVVSRWRRRGEDAHLRLAAGPLQVRHEVPRHPPGDGRAVVLLHEREREVQRAGDPAGRRDVPVPDVDRLRIHQDPWKGGSERVRERPVGRRPPAVEQPGGSQDAGSGAHGRHPPAHCRQPPHVADEPLVGRRVRVAQAARDDHRVERPA
jgi:hypothetical protein